MGRLLNILFALVFGSFAYLNLNDADAWLWVSIYGIIAVLFVLAVLGRGDRKVIGALCIAVCIWAMTMVPGMLDWIDADMPSITDEMQASAPHVEEVREFLGLAIASFALIILFFTTPKEARFN